MEEDRYLLAKVSVVPYSKVNPIRIAFRVNLTPPPPPGGVLPWTLKPTSSRVIQISVNLKKLSTLFEGLDLLFQ